MSKKEKLVQRLLMLPKDFTFAELESLFIQLGFEIDNKGRTSGSRIRFYNKEKQMQYLAHKPHPASIIKEKAFALFGVFFLHSQRESIERHRNIPTRE